MFRFNSGEKPPYSHPECYWESVSGAIMAFRHPRLTENKKTSQVRYNLTRFADSMFRGIQYVANIRIISGKSTVSHPQLP